MRAAIYARFSTPDKYQDVENQLARLRQYAQTQNWTMELYIDHESGKHANREAFSCAHLQLHPQGLEGYRPPE